MDNKPAQCISDMSGIRACASRQDADAIHCRTAIEKRKARHLQ